MLARKKSWFINFETMMASSVILGLIAIAAFAVIHEIKKENQRDLEFMECVSKNGTYIHGIRYDLCVGNVIPLESAKK